MSNVPTVKMIDKLGNTVIVNRGDTSVMEIWAKKGFSIVQGSGELEELEESEAVKESNPTQFEKYNVVQLRKIARSAKVRVPDGAIKQEIINILVAEGVELEE